MSKTALMLLSDGSTRPVDIDEIPPHDKGHCYLCDGEYKGSCCRAQVSPVRRVGGSHFRILPGLQHIPGCPKDESEAAVIRRHLDVTGANVDLFDLFDQFGHHSEHTPSTEPGRGTPPSHGPIDPNHIKTKDDRPIELGLQNPKNCKQFCALLIKSDVNDYYAHTLIRDLIVDKRTVESYRANGLVDAQLAVVLTHRVGTARANRLVPNKASQDLILTDAYAYHDRADPLVYVINGDRGAREIIFTAQPDHIIAIYGIWHPHPTLPNTYICDPITSGHVFSDTPSFFDT